MARVQPGQVFEGNPVLFRVALFYMLVKGTISYPESRCEIQDWKGLKKYS